MVVLHGVESAFFFSLQVHSLFLTAASLFEEFFSLCMLRAVSPFFLRYSNRDSPRRGSRESLFGFKVIGGPISIGLRSPPSLLTCSRLPFFPLRLSPFFTRLKELPLQRNLEELVFFYRPRRVRGSSLINSAMTLSRRWLSCRQGIPPLSVELALETNSPLTVKLLFFLPLLDLSPLSQTIDPFCATGTLTAHASPKVTPPNTFSPPIA